MSAILLAFAFLTADQPVFAESLKVHPRVSAAWQQYISLWNPMYFAVSEDGHWAGYVTCTSSSWACSDREGRRTALNLCRKVSGGKASCKLYARAKSVVWRGPAIDMSGEQRASDLPPNPTILENFKKIAFYSEFAEQETTRPLIKWHSPIRIAVRGESPAKYREQVARFAADLARVTGHAVSMARREGNGGEDANVHVYFSRSIYDDAIGRYRAAVDRHLRGKVDLEYSLAELEKSDSLCFAIFVRKNRRSAEIAQAVVFIPTTLNRKLTQACVVEELTQILGLTNDSDDVYPSIFNDTSPFYALTAHDKLLLRLLYDNRLKAGMNWQEAKPIAKRILAEIGPGDS